MISYFGVNLFYKNLLYIRKTNLLIIIMSLYIIDLHTISFSQDMGQSSEVKLTSEEVEWLNKHPVIKATNYSSWAPIDYNIAGRPTGFSIEYLNLVAEKVGIEIAYISDDSLPNLFQKLKDKEIDIGHGIVQTEERNNYLKFTEPYVEFPLYYFGRVGAPPINKLSDLDGRRVGIISGIASADVIKRNYSYLTLIEQETVLDAFQALGNGSIDVFAVILPIANYTISRFNISGVEVIGSSVIFELRGGNPVRLAVRDDWDILRGILQKGMDAISTEEFHELSEKWQAEYVKSDDIGLTYDEKRWLLDNQEIKVAVDPTIAPFEFIDQNGNISGVSGSYLNEIEELLNVDFVWSSSESFNVGLEQIKSGDAYFSSAIIETEERKKFLTFTDSYISLVNVIFTREGGEIYGNMDGLYGRTIAQVKGFATQGFIKNDYPEVNIIEVDNIFEALRLVALGEVDAYIGDIMTSSFYITDNGLTDIIVAGDTPYSTKLSMGVGNQHPLLASAIQKALRAIPVSRKAEIEQSWLHVEVDNSKNYDEFIKVISISIAIISFILIWIYSMRREIETRKKREKELKIAQVAAAEANKAKSNFLSNMSHEIRTPLNAIIGFSEVMSTGVYGDIKEEKYKEYINDIKNSGEHLATVVNDILDLSKIDLGNWTLDESDFDILASIKETLKMLQAQAADKGIKIFNEISNKDSQIIIHGDEHSIRRAMINLLSNAIKFTPKGGKIICKVIKSDEGAFKIIIKDTGIGIDPNKIDLVLSPFGQGHDPELIAEAGTGLGLPIVKQLIELHDGEFILESEVGVGTTATIILPIDRIKINNF